MEKIVVVSANNNPDYLFYAPYIQKAWAKFGWKVCIMVTHDVDINKLDFNSKDGYIISLPEIKELREQTVAQASRLYAASVLPLDCYIMISDIDLLPLSDYWKPDFDAITVYGYDLTWRSYYPMGYIGMTCDKWKKYMNLTANIEADMLRDARETKIAYSDNWEEWWNFDWDLVTKRLKPFEKDITFIDRGQIEIAGATLARGRIDRYNWVATQNQPEPFIDAHCENNNVQHPDKLNKFIEVFKRFHNE